MKQKIIEFAKNIDVEMIGFSNYERNFELVKRHQEKYLLEYNVPFNYPYQEIDNLTKILPNVDTIISIALPYYKTCEYLDNIKDNEVYFSASSWGEDYHKVLNEKMELIAQYIKNENSSFEYAKCVDTSPIDDRYLAYKAGIGFFGKNGLIINKKYGSYIFIGNLLTNLHLEPDKPIKDECFGCDLCVKNCPGKAITNKGINSRLCLSYITQKKELTKSERLKINKCIYGCDKCMQICPYNGKITSGYHKFKPTGIEFIDIGKFKQLSNREFKEKYGHLAGSWRGKKIIERNIKIYQEKN